jgi:hypothetical protein
MLQRFHRSGLESTPTKTPANDSVEKQYDDVRAEDGLMVLLLYRALLCTCLCATAADISCVEGTALGQRVVQIL